LGARRPRGSSLDIVLVLENPLSRRSFFLIAKQRRAPMESWPLHSTNTFFSKTGQAQLTPPRSSDEAAHTQDSSSTKTLLSHLSFSHYRYRTRAVLVVDSSKQSQMNYTLSKVHRVAARAREEKPFGLVGERVIILLGLDLVVEDADGFRDWNHSDWRLSLRTRSD
jgi:hypothetical protein